MAKVIDVPGYGPTEFPDSMSDDQIVAAIQKNMIKSNSRVPAGTQFPLPVGRAGFADAMQETLAEASPSARMLAGFGSGARNLYEGAKQMVGMGDPTAIEGNKMIRQAAPVSAFAGDVASFIPAAGIPGLNTMAGATALGGVYGGLQPAESMQQRGTSAAFGAAGGAAGKYVGDKVANKATNWLANKQAVNAARRAENQVVDKTLNEAHRAGYVFPPTAMNKTSYLEGVSGQFKTQQEAAWRNQQITNNLARQELGLKAGEPITEGAFKTYFKTMGKAYDDVAKLSPKAAQELEQLKAARFNSKLHTKHYNMQGDPDALAKAQSFMQEADMLETVLEQRAVAAGKPNLVPALREARRNIAKAHSYEDAVRFSTGDVNAAELARAYRAGVQGSGPKVSGNIERIGKIADARPESLKMRGFAPNPTTALDSATMAISGAASGSPSNLLAAGVPLLRGPVRNYLLSPSAQAALRPRPSDYAVGQSSELLKWMLANPVTKGAAPGVGYGLLNPQR